MKKLQPSKNIQSSTSERTIEQPRSPKSSMKSLGSNEVFYIVNCCTLLKGKEHFQFPKYCSILPLPCVIRTSQCLLLLLLHFKERSMFKVLHDQYTYNAIK